MRQLFLSGLDWMFGPNVTFAGGHQPKKSDDCTDADKMKEVVQSVPSFESPARRFARPPPPVTPRSTPVLQPKFRHSPMPPPPPPPPDGQLVTANLLASLNKSITQIRDWLAILEAMLENEKVDISDVANIYFMLERQKVSAKLSCWIVAAWYAE